MHKAGFVNIIGNPNVGKSTLMNALMGERLSIITHKAQTTRHRILGIVSGDDFQVVLSDTPGIIKPAYDLYSFKVLPVLGRLVADDSDSYQYLAESIRMHPDQDTLASMMQDAGFERVRYQNLAGGIVALHSGYRI